VAADRMAVAAGRRMPVAVVAVATARATAKIKRA